MPETAPGAARAAGSVADASAGLPARERILGRLRVGRTAVGAPALAHATPAGHAAGHAGVEPPTTAEAFFAAKTWPPAERLARLRRCMEAVKTEFVAATAATWPEVVRDLLRAAGARSLMAGAGSPLAAPLAAACAGGDGPSLVLYDRPVEEIKASLFSSVDAGITCCVGAIAETGGLILCPSPEEPRLLSLVPPIHLVLLDPARLWDTLWQAVRELGWARSIPRHALVISGPSKTADIEQTLAYGVHGPKRLVVVLVPGGLTHPAAV